MSNMQERPDSDDYPRIFLQDVPLIDVRAPIEFQQGAFARAVNLPLMIDSERRAVGTCYKQHGQQAALALGHRTVNGKLREQRTAAGWRPAERPAGYIYCFRGGLRSQLVQQWLHEAGVDYPRITGGYKALRNYLLGVLTQSAALPMAPGGWQYRQRQDAAGQRAGRRRRSGRRGAPSRFIFWPNAGGTELADRF